MLNLKASEAIQLQARSFIQKKNFESFLQNYGTVFYTGSYALNLMTWRDIDLQIKIDNSSKPIETIKLLLHSFLADQDTINAKYINFTNYKKSYMPEGYYLGLKMWDKYINENWKIDIWILAEHDFQKNRDFIDLIKQNLTDDKKRQILDIKFKLKGDNDNPPSLSSYYVYQAILIEKIEKEKDIMSFLRMKGVTC